MAVTGGLVTATTARTTMQVMGGRTDALRNIFGSDPEMLGQSVALARLTFKADDHWIVNARAARTRTSNVAEFTRTVDASQQAGGGARWEPVPAIQFVADGSYVQFRATGAARMRRDYSYLSGMHVLLARGFLEVNANRFSPGDLPLVNAPLQDRSGLFASGEYDLFSRARLFGGWEAVQTNITPAGDAAQRPEATSDRAFGGVRVRVGDRSTLSVRVEGGGRVENPIPGQVITNGVVRTVSDTGSVSADWQTSLRAVTAFARVERRNNVGVTNATSTFSQDNASGQLYLNLSRQTQLFGSATATRQAGSGSSTYVELSAGGQQQIFTPGLWLRLEGTVSRNRDLTADLLSPRDAVSVGLNGQIARNTSIGLNVYVDRAPVGFDGGSGAWLARSTLRVVHTIPTGSVRLSAAGGGHAGGAAHGTGSITGTVFADWNENGQPDPGEETLAGIPIRLGAASNVTTAHDGQFSFLDVPAGAQQVGIDLNALPVDFDPPDVPDVTVELSRGDTRRVAFGLVPLGSIHGVVVRDSNGNGAADPGEPRIAGAVLTLDGGQRSELARTGTFAFDAVRAGAHRVELLKDSLPDGAVIVGAEEQSAAITKAQPHAEVAYLVRVEKRPEVRKVFPRKIGSNAAPGRRGASGPSIASREPHRRPEPHPSVRQPAPASRPGAAPPPGRDGAFTIQIAALEDSLRAREMVDELRVAGFAAYLVEPGRDDPDGPFRVRVGRFASRGIAQQTVGRLEARLNQKLWVTRAAR